MRQGGKAGAEDRNERQDMKNFANMLKQAQELQGRVAEMQKELETLEIVGESGGGLVRVTLTGKGALAAIRIDPGLAKPDDVEILEDLIVAAHTDAKSKLEVQLQEKMQQVTGGMPLPPGLGV